MQQAFKTCGTLKSYDKEEERWQQIKIGFQFVSSVTECKFKAKVKGLFSISPEEYKALSLPQEYASNNKDYHKQVQNFYENNAFMLTPYKGDGVFKSMFYEYQMAYHHSAPFLKGKKRFIEIGCASGYHVFNFAPHFQEVLGLDISWYDATAPEAGERSAVEAAQEIVRQTDSTVNIQTGTIESLSIEKSFDVIFSNYLLEHIPDLPIFIEECVKRLEPGGLFMAIVPNGYFLLRDIIRFNLDKVSIPRVVYRSVMNLWLKIRGKKSPFSYGITPNGWCVPNAHSEFCKNFMEQFEKRYELQNYLQPILESGMEFLKVEIIKDDTYLIIAQKPYGRKLD